MNVPITPELSEKLVKLSLPRSYQWCRHNAHQFGRALQRKHLLSWWYVTKILAVLRLLVRDIHIYLPLLLKS